MGESNDSINGILLENIDKKVPINFSLLSTPIKDTPSIRKTSTISKLENYIDENYDEEKKDTLMNFSAVFTIEFPHLLAF